MKYIPDQSHLSRLIAVFALSFCVFCSSSMGQGSQETLTNQEIITMLRVGLSPTVIINKIRASKTQFDLSTNELIKLKDAGVTNEILEAMQGYSESTDVPMRPPSMPPLMTSTAPPGPDPNDPLTPRDVGIYLFTSKDGQKSFIELEPSAVTRNRSGSKIATTLTQGIWVTKEKAMINGSESAIKTKEPYPVFYFYLNEKDRTMAVVRYFPASVNQFQLVKFDQKKGVREVTIGKVSSYYGKTGIPNDRIMEISIDKVGDGIYKVTPKQVLKPGEYGFYLIGTGAGIGATFYDFSVRPDM